MHNEGIRQTAREAGVRHWEIADVIGISESQLSRMLRYPLDSEGESEIMAAIAQLKAGDVECKKSS